MSAPTLQRSAASGSGAASGGSPTPVSGPRRTQLTRFIWRWRLAAICLLLGAFSFVQDPGRIAADTKLDLAVNPGGLLTRAMHLWDPQSFSGSLQNQAYGYLWPMGPFYWLTEAMGVPAWVAQRLWWSILLSLAFLGVVKLVRLLGLGGPLARVLGGLVYALSPMMLSKIGPISSEALPIAMAPWVLIPLVCAASRGSTRRWAALSGLAVLCAGGVNAIAAAAVLPLALMWILTRTNGRRKWSLLGWWSGSVVLATLWWAIPLLLLGRYSPPFLDWIESSAITTSITDPSAVLRGTSDWLAYLSESAGPAWMAGWTTVTNRLVIAATGLLALLGLIGLVRRGVPNRSFLVLGLFAGFAAVSLGHVGEIATGLGSTEVRQLMDGALSPLRNVHKFDLVLRLPLALGLAWLVTSFSTLAATDSKTIRTPAWRKSWTAAGPKIFVGALCGAIFIGSMPLLLGQLSRGRSFVEIPPYWAQASEWMAQQPDSGRALVVPGASFGHFFWGRTQDEPLQALGAQSWDVRDAVPLSNAGHTRILDAINQEIESGQGSAGLAPLLERSGFRWLVIRNDIDRSRTGAPFLSVLYQALERSPGISPVATFGDPVSQLAQGGRTSEDGIEGTRQAVEVFRVGPPGAETPKVAMRNAQNPWVLTGAAEGVLPLGDAGALGGRTVAIADDPGVENLTNPVIIATDSGRRREVNFGFSRDNASPAMTASQPFSAVRAVHDYSTNPASAKAVAELTGIKSVTASSSGAFANAVLNRAASAQPYSALDLDPATSWRTGTFAAAVGQWWQVDFEKPIATPRIGVTLALGAGLARPTRLAVTTDAGRKIVQVKPVGQKQIITLTDKTTTFLRIELVAGDTEGSVNGFGLAEVAIPGVHPRRALRMAGTQPASAAFLAAAPGERSNCVLVEDFYRCSDLVGATGEDRSVVDRWVLLNAGEYRVKMAVLPKPGSNLDQRLNPIGEFIGVTASSQLVSDPPARASAALDGDMATTWVAQRFDKDPTLVLKLPRKREIRGVKIVTAAEVAVSKPLSVSIQVNGQRVQSFVPGDGVIRLPPTLTDKITLAFDQVVPRLGVDASKQVSQLPVGVSEIVVLGAGDLSKGLSDKFAVAYPCGFGPSVVVDDSTTVKTGGSIRAGKLLSQRPAALPACGAHRTVKLAAGWHHIRAAASFDFLVDRLEILPATMPLAPPPPGSVEVRSWGPVDRVVAVSAAAHEQTIEVAEAYNQGWTASLDGNQLAPLQVDGWRQAWLVPAGVGGDVQLEFVPDDGYRKGLLVGLLAVVLLLIVGAWRAREPGGPAVTGAALPRLVVAVGAVALLLTIGPWGLLAGAVAAAVSFLGSKRLRPEVLVAGFGAIALACQVVWPWPESTMQPAMFVGLASLAVAGVLGVVAAAGLGSPARWSTAPPVAPGDTSTGADVSSVPDGPAP